MIVTRRRLTPDARRLEFLETAERLLRDRGGALRVADIMQEAKAAKGTFFAYFPTFHDLLDEIRSRQSNLIRARLVARLGALSGAERQHRLNLFAEIFIDFLIELGGLHEVLFHSDFTVARPMPEPAKPAAAIAALLREGMADGLYADLDPDMTAPLIFAAIHEAADRIIAGVDRGKCLTALAAMLDRAVLASPRQASLPRIRRLT